MHLDAKFDVEKWDETPFDGVDAPKMTRAVVTKRYSGDIAGTSTTEWLMLYGEDGSATFVGIERISGVMSGREGSLVLRHIGSFENGVAKGVLDVVEGGGSGALRSAAGDGQFLADPGGSVKLNLNFD